MKKQTGLAVVVAVALTTLGAASARADVVYNYTGNDFTQLFGPSYTASDSVTGSLTLSTALGANLTDTAITPTSFTFSDGVQTITNANSTAQTFIVWTDATGGFLNWAVEVLEATGLFGDIKTINPPGSFGIRAEDLAQIFPDAANNFDSPGVWSMGTTVITTTPLPAALPLFGTGLGALGLLGWWRKRKNGAPLSA